MPFTDQDLATIRRHLSARKELVETNKAEYVSAGTYKGEFDNDLAEIDTVLNKL